MIKPENYYVVQGWMATELKLTGISLQVYAIIHGFSQDDKSVYNGGKQYLMEWCGCSERQIINVLAALTEKGFIEKIPAKIHGQDGYAYRGVKKVHPCNNFTPEKSSPPTSEIISPPTPEKSSPRGVKSVHPQSADASYSPNDLPPAPYNKDIKNDIKKNKKEEDNARATAHSFSFQENGKTIIAIPCTDGELTFSGEDVKDLQAAFVDLNIIAELKQIVLKVKTAKVEMTADRARRYVTSWMVNSQNKRASSSNLWQNQNTQALAPEDPNNHLTHPQYNRNGDMLDYDGNIIKTAQQIRQEEQAERDRKDAERIAELERSQEEFDRLHPDLPDVIYRRKRKLEAAQQKQNPAPKKTVPNYAAMSEDELKAQLKPLQGEQLWQYRVRTDKVKKQLAILQEQQQNKAVNE